METKNIRMWRLARFKAYYNSVPLGSSIARMIKSDIKNLQYSLRKNKR